MCAFAATAARRRGAASALVAYGRAHTAAAPELDLELRAPWLSLGLKEVADAHTANKEW